MNFSTAMRQLVLQIGLALLEAEIKDRLKKHGIRPEDFERQLKEILERSNRPYNTNAALNASKVQTTTQALKELELPITASPQEIKSKFKKMVLDLHPDGKMELTSSERSGKENHLKKVIKSYKTLQDSGRV